ncbi:3-hydroxy-9,10-secoandrosta-1,3,5(10)-triene-9,17-dione monooxygenase reductase component [Actinoplanes campanulatus]|uniref:3-hydroxy-9,10-secoandrosta-1,3,5(10)-triene-9, 17-dione monooxygenase reductase component n=1 Tax=Actinoplanes campanulatus TaxID=113559 RepID=A0A7W5AHQ5_9ACTN|nr:3-hydroxy-9,10-secoandrosta-1,3,5(10)-triene-9,17-dione monooxygenase reductase component [Actinoplanes campanulatus]
MTEVTAAGLEPARFRRVFGHFGTGVTVITTADDDGPAGFACQSFAPLSLDPPLVLFCARNESETWRRIRAAGVFGVNVLASGQRDVSRLFGTRGADRFAALDWAPAPSGAPVLADVLTWADCAVEAVHPGGDHVIVIGRVTALGPCRDVPPLLFYRSRYTSTAPNSPYEPPEVVDTLLSWPRHTDWI